MAFTLHVLNGPLGTRRIMGVPERPVLTDKLQKKLKEKDKPAKLPAYKDMFDTRKQTFTQSGRNQTPTRSRPAPKHKRARGST